MNALLQVLITALFGISGTVIVAKIQRKKHRSDIDKMRAETEGKELDNVEKAIEIWRGLVRQLGHNVHALSQECQILRSEVSSLRLENKSLKEEMSALSLENKSLKEEIRNLERTIHNIQQ